MNTDIVPVSNQTTFSISDNSQKPTQIENRDNNLVNPNILSSDNVKPPDTDTQSQNMFSNIITGPDTSAPNTSAPVTTAPVTTAPVTTAPVMTVPVTTALASVLVPSDILALEPNISKSSMKWFYDLLKLIQFLLLLPLLVVLGFYIFFLFNNTRNSGSRIIENIAEFFKSFFPKINTNINVMVRNSNKISKKNIGTSSSTSGIDVLDKTMVNKVNTPKKPSSPAPDSVGNVTQVVHKGGKSGYCYIGEDRGFRSCVRVGNTDKCMSGDIFPREDVCINPNLRT